MLTFPVHRVASGVEEPDRVMVRGSTGRRSKALQGRRRTPTGLEQPAPAPPGLYAGKICAESERGAPEILPADRIEVIARPRHPFEFCAAFSSGVDENARVVLSHLERLPSQIAGLAADTHRDRRAECRLHLESPDHPP